MVYANSLWHHILEYGLGPPVVLLPGMTAAAATYAFFAKALAPGHRVFVPDVRGRGLSDHPESGFTLDDYAADLLGILDRLDVASPILVGHSMGARIAAAFDVAFPNRVAGLVLIDPPLSGPGRDPYPYPPAMYHSMFEIARSTDDPIAAMREIEPNATDAALAERIRWLRATDEQAIVETYRGFHDEDYHALHASVSAPAILVRGERSAVVTAAGADELRRLRKDIPVIDIPDAAHLVPQENLAATGEVVRRFGRRLRETPR
ncbi:MAG TPA: alpha/beta hydrolase [Solirubrobacteraceae bacterium]|nr:alpha/beta hydrolase [Solirubrobacteraceae bacterium]